MFYNKVILGKQHHANQPEELIAAPKGYHSIIGQLNGYSEYIVYRYGQALPYIKIIYRSS